ncbi:hypothetical protein GALL_424590 [mine drainage metagenome]|uniref:Uncharacterized protein n=1 Tax=mine drainage metagenome TaxID=410659 RepID=A0A1J5Q788_9ZZZZ
MSLAPEFRLGRRLLPPAPRGLRHRLLRGALHPVDPASQREIEDHAGLQVGGREVAAEIPGLAQAAAGDAVEGVADAIQEAGLARAGGELQGKAAEFWVGFGVGLGQVIQEALAALAQLRRNLGEPDRSFHRLDLAEKRTDAGERMMAPVLQQARGFRRDAPCGRRQQSPLVHFLAHRVDDGGVVVLLRLGGQPLSLVEYQRGLIPAATLLARLGNRGDEVRRTTRLLDDLRRLAGCIQLPMPRRTRVGRVQDGLIEERVGHGLCHPLLVLFVARPGVEAAAAARGAAFPPRSAPNAVSPVRLAIQRSKSDLRKRHVPPSLNAGISPLAASR